MIWTPQSVMFNMTQSANLRFNYGQTSKRSALAYMDWEKKQPKNVHQIDTGEYKVVIDGVENLIFLRRKI